MAEEAEQVDVWYAMTDERSGRIYYYNRAREITQWEKPKGYVVDTREFKKEEKDTEEKAPRQRSSFTQSLRDAGDRLKQKKLEKPCHHPSSTSSSPSCTSLSPSKSPSKSTKVSNRKTETQGKVKWIKKRVATFGDSEESEFYYVSEYGDTQWDRPEDYESEDELERREESEEICFDRMQSVHEVLVELGAIQGDESGETLDIVTDRENMIDAGRDVDAKCEKRLRQIFLAVKYCGTPEEWEEVVQANDYDLVKNIFLHWGQGGRTPNRVRALTCILLETFMKLDSSLIRHYVDDAWGLKPQDFLSNIEHGLRETRDSDKSFFSWLSLLYSFLTEVPKLPQDAMPGRDTIALLVSFMSVKDEDVFLMATYVLLALHSHLGFSAETTPPQAPETGDENLSITSNHKPNIVLEVMDHDRRNSELFSEAVMHLLNGQSYPYEDPILLGQVLYFVRAVFSTRASADFFHTTDLRVIVDIIVTQLKDLPLEDEFRCDYLRILHLLMLHATEWKKYRRESILDSLDFVIQARANGMHPLAIKFAVCILLDCVDYLQ